MLIRVSQQATATKYVSYERNATTGLHCQSQTVNRAGRCDVINDVTAGALKLISSCKWQKPGETTRWQWVNNSCSRTPSHPQPIVCCRFSTDFHRKLAVNHWSTAIASACSMQIIHTFTVQIQSYPKIHSLLQCGNCREGFNPPPSSRLQALDFFEWKSVLNFSPCAKFQTFQHLTPPVLSG